MTVSVSPLSSRLSCCCGKLGKLGRKCPVAHRKTMKRDVFQAGAKLRWTSHSCTNFAGKKEKKNCAPVLSKAFCQSVHSCKIGSSHWLTLCQRQGHLPMGCWNSLTWTREKSPDLCHISLKWLNGFTRCSGIQCCVCNQLPWKGFSLEIAVTGGFKALDPTDYIGRLFFLSKSSSECHLYHQSDLKPEVQIHVLWISWQCSYVCWHIHPVLCVRVARG